MVIAPARAKNATRILLIDIETFPILGYMWGTYQQNVLRIVQDTSICCFSAKWLGGKQVTHALPDFPGYKPGNRDDKRLVEELWRFLDEADVVVAHNGKSFDVKKINSRFTRYEMKPPSPYKVVDTLTEARKVGSYDSNHLNDLGKFHNFGEKLSTGGFELWEGCMAGDFKAWKKMKLYNAQDVVLLEKLYLRLLPWMKNHPNLAVQHGEFTCPKCGSSNLYHEGMAYNQTTAYPRYKCRDCGAWSRDTRNAIKREDKPFVAI